MTSRTPDAWERILSDDSLSRARSKLSIHELRSIIRHVHEAGTAEQPSLRSALMRLVRASAIVEYQADDCGRFDCREVDYVEWNAAIQAGSALVADGAPIENFEAAQREDDRMRIEKIRSWATQEVAAIVAKGGSIP